MTVEEQGVEETGGEKRQIRFTDGPADAAEARALKKTPSRRSVFGVNYNPPVRFARPFASFASIAVLLVATKILLEDGKVGRVVYNVRNLLLKRREAHNIAKHVLSLQRCDHDNWNSGGLNLRYWREDVRKCATYDLSLRSAPLQDQGVQRLVDALTGTFFLRSSKKLGKPNRQLKYLDLQGNELTAKSAALLARWISTEPEDPNDSRLQDAMGEGWSVLGEPERIPTALLGTRSQPFELHVEGNPIMAKGRQQLMRAVDRAAEYGVYVIVFGGGYYDPPRHNSLKLGPLLLELGAKKIDKEDMQEWRYPPTLKNDLRDLSTPVLFFILGMLVGVLTASKPVKRRLVEGLKSLNDFQIFAMKVLISAIGTGLDESAQPFSSASSGKKHGEQQQHQEKQQQQQQGQQRQGAVKLFGGVFT